MQTLVARKSHLQLLQVHEPPLTSHSVKVRLHWSAMSFGTEHNTLAGQKTGAILKAGHYWRKALGLLRQTGSPARVLERYAKLKRGLSPLGYSAVGEVIACGRRVNVPLPQGTLVHVGGEYASHADIVTVPQNFVFPLPEQRGPIKPALSLATIASVPIHAVLHARDCLPTSMTPSVLVVGGGIIGTFGGLFAASMGCRVSLFDTAPTTLADAFLPRRSTGERYDMILVCTPSMQGIEAHLEAANEGCVLSVVGETPLQVDRGTLEDKYMTVRFCKSFGYGRGNKAYEFGCADVDTSRFPHTLRANISRGLTLLDALAPQLEGHINIMSPADPQPRHDQVNVFKWNS